MSDQNNNRVITLRAQDTIIHRGSIVAIMPYKMPPPQGNISKAIIQFPVALKSKPKHPHHADKQLHRKV